MAQAGEPCHSEGYKIIMGHSNEGLITSQSSGMVGRTKGDQPAIFVCLEWRKLEVF